MADGELDTVVARPPRRRLGDLLLAAGVVEVQDVNDAVDLAAPGERVGAVLVRLGLAEEAQVADALATQLRLQRAGPDELASAEHGALALVPLSLAERYDVLPLAVDGDVLQLAMSDPSDVAVLDDVRLRAGVRHVRPAVATAGELRRARRRAYRRLDDGRSPGDHAVDSLERDGAGGPVIAALDALLCDAVTSRASDIHLEPAPVGARIRLRVDGVLRDAGSLPDELHRRVCSRIKLLAEMDITERRRPQDGRLRIRIAEQQLDLRVATMPTLLGEAVVLRLLPRIDELRDLDELGFPRQVLDGVRRGLARPQGLVLLTGPTGAGKTTTAYSALATTDAQGRNVRTLEDPVEIRWLGVNQTQIDPSVGLTFAAGLRHLLRQDPDVLLVGEVRDRETAALAVEAASTGHLVVATLHTNDATSAIARLADLGADRFLLAGALDLVLAQRLVRTVCERCAIDDEPGSRLLTELDLSAPQLAGARLRRGVGCDACDHTGVGGRTAVGELLPVDPVLRQRLFDQAGQGALLEAARSHGMVTLREAALALAWTGRITLAEALRATPTPPWPASPPASTSAGGASV